MEDVRYYQHQSFTLVIDATCEYYVSNISHLDDESLYKLSLQLKPPNSSASGELTCFCNLFLPS